MNKLMKNFFLTGLIISMSLTSLPTYSSDVYHFIKKHPKPIICTVVASGILVAFPDTQVVPIFIVKNTGILLVNLLIFCANPPRKVTVTIENPSIAQNIKSPLGGGLLTAGAAIAYQTGYLKDYLSAVTKRDTTVTETHLDDNKYLKFTWQQNNNRGEI